MGMHAMLILPRFVLALDLLQAVSGGDAIENILHLSRGYMPFMIAQK